MKKSKTQSSRDKKILRDIPEGKIKMEMGEIVASNQPHLVKDKLTDPVISANLSKINVKKTTQE